MALKILVGSDPEAFAFSNTGNPWCPVGYIPGTKTAPYIVKDGAIQIDGMAVEWNIDPADNEEDFVQRLKGVFKEITTRIPYTSKVEIKPTAEFKSLSPYTLDQVQLGCLPDWNAYTEEVNPPPKMPGNDPYKQLLRTAAGHVHAGWTKNIDIQDKNHRDDCFAVVKQLDYYLGLPSLYWDEDKKRRELYGKAGACRIKPYGVEYRVLSNQWLRGINDPGDKDLMGFVYRQTVRALKDLHKGNSAYEHYEGLAKELIDNNERPDGNLGKELMKKFYPDLPERFYKKAG